jgi:hypothetical protein
VPGDDAVDLTVEGRRRLVERAADFHGAAAVVRIEQRDVLPGKDVAGVRDAQRREQDPGVAVGMSPPEVAQLDPVVSGAVRQPIGEPPRRPAGAGVLL